ncbi:transglycosylase SLT domain-containing protein [Bradyrhizobium liaoningense]|nr:transglycosylase SLT domain-containing protein [Bradyrhizobium liaoningense]
MARPARRAFRSNRLRSLTLAESNLNPNAVSAPPEEGIGLFQLNRRGLGTGHSREELENP